MLKDSHSANNVEVLANTSYLQAVNHKTLHLCQAVFYEAGEVVVSNELKIASESPCILMVKYEGNSVSGISVTDPARELSKVHIHISGKVMTDGENYKASWNASENMSEVAIDMPQGMYAGSSVTIKLN